MRAEILRLSVLSILMLLFVCGAPAQEISGFSTLSFVTVRLQPTPGGGASSQLGCIGPRCSGYTYVREAQAYADTEEDYTASLYYNVQSNSAIYSGGNSSPDATHSFTGNPSASGSFLSGISVGTVKAPLKSEVTDHVVDFFYISSVGEYYDPYGFSIIQNNPDGDFNSGYWFSVYVYATYISEAAVIVGEDWDAGSDSWGTNFQGPNTENVMYQAFIPPDYITGPPASGCNSVIYAGDNRGFNPQLGSFRAMQAIGVGVGGYTGIYPANAPPAQATGWTYQFSSAVLQNNQIPPSAYNWDYLGQCTSHGINELGHASTATMDEPGVIYNGSNNTQTTLSGSATNPVPLFAFAIQWNVPLTLTEPTVSDLHVSGTLNATCYPAHEVSVGGVDLAGGTWSPSSNSLVYITGCLGGISNVHQTINADIPLIPPTPLGGVL